MMLVPIETCRRDWDFRPLSAWPQTWPVVSWNRHLLTGFDRTVSSISPAMNFESADVSLVDLFADTYPDLTLPELSRWLSKAELTSGERTQLLARYNLQPHEYILKVLSLLPSLPESFQDWCSHKAVPARDLQILTLCSKIEALFPVLDFIARSQVSKSDGCQALEWCVELFETQKMLLEFEEKSFSQWQTQLQAHRFPMTQQKQDGAQKWVDSLPWPQHTQARWIRRGDETGIEVKLFVRSPEDGRKKLESLQRLEKQLNTDGNPWT